MKRLFIIGFIFISRMALSTTIIIEPDDYENGINLSHISPYVSLTTTMGEAVYSSKINNAYNFSAAEGADTGPLGKSVFSTSKAHNSEWFYWKGWCENDGLKITFNQAVDSFTLLFAELFPDAGPYYDDPIKLYIFDVNDQLIDSIWGGNYSSITYLDDNIWPYYNFEYFGDNIGSVIVGGESEPTTIDCLSFTFAQDVPEPATSILFIMLFSFISWNRFKK